jgi:type I site-specific restriction endonuclease
MALTICMRPLCKFRLLAEATSVRHTGKGFIRKPPKRVDYLLRYTRDFNLAVVEAKAGYKTAADGVQQARAGHCERLRRPLSRGG